MQKLPYIDALRGWAILLVCTLHAWMSFGGEENYFPIAVNDFIGALRAGVPLFFLVSAFTLSRSAYLRGEMQYSRAYFLRRFFRTAPMYYLSIVAYYPLVMPSLGILATNILLVFGLMPDTPTAVPGGWSLGAEEIFYWTLPLLLMRIKNRRQAVDAIAISSLFFIVCMNVGNRIHSLVSLTAVAHFPNFLLGILMYFVIYEKEGPPVRAASVVWLMALCWVRVTVLNNVSVLPNYFVLTLLTCPVLYLMHQQRIALLENKLTVFLGKISYSLYLTHSGALYAMQAMGIFSLVPLTDRRSAFVNLAYRFTVMMAISVPVSYLTYRFIEKPFIKLGHRLAEK